MARREPRHGHVLDHRRTAWRFRQPDWKRSMKPLMVIAKSHVERKGRQGRIALSPRRTRAPSLYDDATDHKQGDREHERAAPCRTGNHLDAQYDEYDASDDLLRHRLGRRE